MADNIDANNSKIIIDEEVGSGGSYVINGHNNHMKLTGAECNKVVIMGHNNIISGTEEYEGIVKLVVLGHNNVVKSLTIRTLEVLGHNNSFKNLQLLREPTNSGVSNKFSNIGFAGEEQNVTHDTAAHDRYEGSSDSDSSSDDSDEGDFTHHHNFNANFDNMDDFMVNIHRQVGDMLSNFNISTNIHANVEIDESQDSSSQGSESEEGYYEEEKYGEEEEVIDEEAHISPKERLKIINSIDSFAYDASSSKEEENCAVCLCKLENKQQVKSLPCKHVFHPK